MTPAEKEYYMQLIQKHYGPRAAAGGALDFAGTVLGFVDDAVSPAATKMQDALVSNVVKIDPKYPLQKGGMLTNKGKVISALSSPNATLLSKGLVGLGAVGGVLGAADVLVGQDNAANKLMDTAAMSVGGFLGAAGGPVGIAAGAGTGKAVSDGLQWLFGDKKTAEQRKLEEALAQLQRGVI